MAGLVCAQQLHQAGYTVVVVEKSRGLGGRVATRRVVGSRADHGLRYLTAQGELSQQFIKALQQRQMLQPWPQTSYQAAADGSLHLLRASTGYVAPEGMTAIAKLLAAGLTICRSQRLEALQVQQRWSLTLAAATDRAEAPPLPLTAAAVVLSIPAPQALPLLTPLAAAGLPAAVVDSVTSVQYAPCLSAIAGYGAARQQDLAQRPQQWQAVDFPEHAHLAWVGLDSSKRATPPQPVMVVQSSADLAAQHLEARDLQPVGHILLQQTAQALSLPWLAEPEWLQVHRWRYAFPLQTEARSIVATHLPLPLVCSGDWCGGDRLESALWSGLDAAAYIHSQLQPQALPVGPTITAENPVESPADITTMLGRLPLTPPG